MNSVLILTKVEILQAIGGARAMVEKRTGKSGAISGTLIIAIALLAGLGWFGFKAHELLGALGLDAMLFSTLLIACGCMTFIFSLPNILGSFFATSDATDLLPLPVTPLAIAISKALQALASSYVWTLAFVAGPLVGWGIGAGAGPAWWLALVLVVLLAPCTPVAYAGTISIVIASASKRLRNKDAITTLTTILTIAMSLAAFFLVQRTNGQPGAAEMLTSVNAALEGALVVFPAFKLAVAALSGDLVACALFCAASLATFVVFIVVVRFLYMRLVTQLTAGSGKAAAYTGEGGKAASSSFQALMSCEVKRIVRNTPILIYYVAYPLLITPILIAFVLMGNSTTSLLEKIPQINDATGIVAGFGLCVFIFLAVLSASSNRLAATLFSREGSNWFFMKYAPVPMGTQIRAKIVPAFVVNALITLVLMGFGAYVLVVGLHVSAIVYAEGVVLALAAAWLMVCMGAWNDSRRPNVAWGNDSELNPKTLKGGGGELRALVVGLAFSALPLVVSPLTGLDPNVFMPVVMVAGVACAIFCGRALLAAAARNLESFE